jgi:glucose-6-phosphate 1-dehydrogenase
MNTTRSDALVFFGATGDLAFKKIFPALQAMAKRGNLNVLCLGGRIERAYSCFCGLQPF